MSSSKLSRCEAAIDPKILRSCESLGMQTLSRWKQWRVRDEIAVRPPPGWPIAATICVFFTYFGVVFFKSYL